LSEQEIVCEDLNLALDDLRGRGFRLDVIYPADDPHTAVLSNADATIRLTTRPGAGPPRAGLPTFKPDFVLTRAGNAGGEGRAGMLYRDLIPDRLGGRYIASHITIPDGGPISDWVHFHHIAVQALYIARGWVRVVYEGQGDPFVLDAGDLVLQPPAIRHRVIESSPGLEVIEIAAPALHATFTDHQMNLPNGSLDVERSYSGQRFLRHIGSEAPWKAYNGGECRETALSEATGGLMEARTVRPGAASEIHFQPHDGELVFGFVLDGSATLEHEAAAELGQNDAFVIPPDQAWRLSSMSDDLSILHITTARL
jgi:mannose-6-phosphate isomerase-like protein (cupin superfamily)